MKIAVLGAGAWGTALAISLAKQHEVTLWARNALQVAEMAEARCNSRYLPGFTYPSELQVESDLSKALHSANLSLAVVPTAGFRPLLREIATTGLSVPLIWACKGFESGTMKLLHEVYAEELGHAMPCGVISGPSFAQEVASGLPTALTLASTDKTFAREAAAQIHSTHLRVYTSEDVIGVELGGAVKNVMAIAAGISDGMGFGYNARAALITRGLAEMTRLGMALGGQPETFMGLTGAGDLILTCTGDLSRNRSVGLKLAKGESLERVLQELGHIAEGVFTAREVQNLARKMNVEMPITEAVCQVLYEGLPAKTAVEALLNRDQKAENLSRQ
ncbi:NAD(P)H-dependent glycerol-3-phosphate dehydrogenase [Sulfurirhabdus autotrophica]|uniref:Glycerol-3-phosphate dehydrogenase [NAD(P)+] n=1 Tax=Sulfurirhabdus autotrophica TaxID=1706046 RepID=A0A4R3Y148_9PROT|nr:NAD(P)H-dependent glycerol-3-phosphate dehydrogenase [Sulfurirhabdus autotrophica]TCV85207.1 glycerol 3-phosphate dehydrogenase (NAD(P)+) [Sulfurirhabdus autotrophica]